MSWCRWDKRFWTFPVSSRSPLDVRRSWVRSGWAGGARPASWCRPDGPTPGSLWWTTPENDKSKISRNGLIQFLVYSGDLTSKLVWYSNGWKQFAGQMVCYSDVPYSDGLDHLITDHTIQAVVTLRLDFIRMVTEVVTLLLTTKPIIKQCLPADKYIRLVQTI